MKAGTERIEAAAFELYAAGPWGEFFSFANGGARAICDAHSMPVYREMVRLALDVALCAELQEAP